MRTIPLTRDKEAIIDDDDYERVAQKKWIANENAGTYYAVESGNPWLFMHRFITGAKRNQVVMHLNDNGLDNRKSNLKVGTDGENKHLRFRDNKGYHWEASRGKWKAMISINHKAVFLGRFDNEEDAARAYKEKKDELIAQILGGASDEVDEDEEDEE